jgi:voltage-gated potassium channel
LISLLAALAGVGTIGYMLIEGWSFTDALFMAVVILSTVGLEAPHPLSSGGRAFTVFLIITGVSVAAYIVSKIGEYVTGGVLTGAFRERRLNRAIGRFTDHYIVCGYGRVGRQIVADLQRRQCTVVVVESDLHSIRDDDRQSVPILVADATLDAALVQAGVTRARGLVAASGSDPTNLVITLSARALHPDLTIVARASDAGAESKIERAGATHVISPYAIGGHRIVSELLSPGLTAFLDAVLHPDQLDLWLDVTTVVPNSPLAGRTLGELAAHPGGGVHLVAIRAATNGAFLTNPPLATRVGIGDTLIALGPHRALEHLGHGSSAPASRIRVTPHPSGVSSRPS